MSKMFIRAFVLSHKCGHCKASKLDGYSVCSKHLHDAKTTWRKRQVIRRKQKKCCYCEKNAFNGSLRCETHTEINKAKCKAWMKQHPERYEEYTKPRKEAFKALGKCHLCPQHRKLEPGYVRCLTCRKKTRVRKA
jgi:hypothetical protein